MKNLALLPLAVMLWAAPAAAQYDVPFLENWTTGLLGERWYTKDQGGIELVDSGNGDKYQRETILFDSGRVFMTKGIRVTAGNAYCLQALIRATPGAAPYLGIWGSNADGMLMKIDTSHWMFGQAGYDTGFGTKVVTVVDDGEWREYAAAFVVPANTTHYVLMNELYVKGKAGTADFDDLRLTAGDCGGKPGASEPMKLEKGPLPRGCSVAGTAQLSLALAASALLLRRRRRRPAPRLELAARPFTAGRHARGGEPLDDRLA